MNLLRVLQASALIALSGDRGLVLDGAKACRPDPKPLVKGRLLPFSKELKYDGLPLTSPTGREMKNSPQDSSFNLRAEKKRKAWPLSLSSRRPGTPLKIRRCWMVIGVFTFFRIVRALALATGLGMDWKFNIFSSNCTNHAELAKQTIMLR